MTNEKNAEEEDTLQQPFEAFAEEREDHDHDIPVQSPKHRRRKKCVVLIVTIVIIFLTAAIAIPLILLVNNDSNTGIKPTSKTSNATASTTFSPTDNPTTLSSVTEKWSSWTSCSVTCGNGTRQRRSRVCTSGSPQSSNCSLNIEQLSCTMTSCIEPASWGQWSQWSPCSVTCANGRQLRSRNCTGGGARPEDKLSKIIKCRGSDQDMRNCSRPACPRRDCLEWFMSGERSNGVYTVDPDTRGSFQVFCDMTTDGGGWTVFQRRQNGSEHENFYRTWDEYKTGFGNLTGEFWLGNDKIHRLSARVLTRLSVDLEAWRGGLKNATYGRFRIENETLNYTLAVESYTGNAGDSFTQHRGMEFTTKDRDNDQEGASNCAVAYKGGWWFKACLPSNLNGQYVGNIPDLKGVIWLAISTNAFNSLKFTQMRIRQST